MLGRPKHPNFFPWASGLRPTLALLQRVSRSFKSRQYGKTTTILSGQSLSSSPQSKSFNLCEFDPFFASNSVLTRGGLSDASSKEVQRPQKSSKQAGLDEQSYRGDCSFWIFYLWPNQVVFSKCTSTRCFLAISRWVCGMPVTGILSRRECFQAWSTRINRSSGLVLSVRKPEVGNAKKLLRI